MRKYVIKECFYSLQGEGIRAGEPSVFLRFAGCNLDCRLETHGFDCDTDFSRGDKLSLDEVVQRVVDVAGDCRWIVLTGGEPGLQVTGELVRAFKARQFKLAIETNGTQALPPGLDWVCVSPKSPEAELRLFYTHEVKFVLRAGDPLPTPTIKSQHYLLSPAWEIGDKNDPANSGTLSAENLEHCIRLCLDNPRWRLSVQQHKWFRIR
jgi:organic radical activating enzyme